MHKADACIITCMDFRFHDRIQAFLKEKGLLGHADEIVIAGGTRDFIDPVEQDDERYAWKEIGLSIQLHDPDKVIFIDHQDCGGYAQDGTIPSGLDKDTDEKGHVKWMRKLKKKFIEHYPDKSINFLYATLHGEIEEVKV